MKSDPQKTKKDIIPEPDETYSEFLDRCTADGTDADECMDIWDESNPFSNSAKPTIVKTTSSKLSKGMDFILSDETVDRYGDVIKADGWDLTHFKKNPIALFSHDPRFPIGKWDDLHVKDGALRGRLHMAPEGTSDRIDELRKLIEAGILKSVSVGFHPLESKPRSKDASGEIYVRQSLVECSVVSTPANPNALAIAKNLKISPATMDLVFAKHGMKKRDVKAGRPNGAHAETRSIAKGGRTMSGPITISQRVKDAEDRVVALKDKLTEHIKAVDDTNPTDEQNEMTDSLTAEIEAAEKSRDSLKKVEKSLAVQSKTPADIAAEHNGSEQSMTVSGRMPFAAPKQNIRPSDYIWKALTVQVRAAANPRMPINEIVQKTYPGQDRLHDNIHAMYQGLITKGGVAATYATTTTATWAAELVTVGIGDFFDLLQPVSIYARLSALGGRFTFGPNGVVSIPYRTSTKTVGGAFVAQGANIPVKNASFSAINLTPKKVGIISTFTRELAEHSTPSIEQLLRDAIVNDTATAIDAILMDNTAATTTRPQGLQNYAGSTQTATTAGSGNLADVIADLKTMSGALASATSGNIRTPVWILSPLQAQAIQLSQLTTIGMMPFREEIAAGRWNGWPIIVSSNIAPADTFWLLDANDFVTATGDTPQFTVSDQAVVVMDDTPTDIVTSGTAFSGGAVKSLYQTDSIAVRMIMDVNWGFRRAGMAFYMSTISWST